MMEHNALKVANLASLHDAELCLISMDRHNATLQIELKDIQGQICQILFHHTINYRIESIFSQNVVSRVFLSNSLYEYDDSAGKIAKWVCSDIDGNLLISEKDLRKHIDDICSGALHLFYVEPSWGAEIGVIAREATVIYVRGH